MLAAGTPSVIKRNARQVHYCPEGGSPSSATPGTLELVCTQQKTLTWQPQNGHPLLLIQLHKVLDGAGVAWLNVQRHLGEQTTHNKANGAWQQLLVSPRICLL